MEEKPGMTTDLRGNEAERSILTGLAWEWERAVWDLPRTYQSRMRLPNFEIRVVASVWGKWMGASKTIVLSQKLVSAYPWFAVREVLLHEMAHQFVDEVMGGHDRPHGEGFQRACELLRADPAASGDPATSDGEHPSIRERVIEGGGGRQDRMAARISKLHALGASNSPHEAETAKRIAEELEQKHKIGHIGAAGSSRFASMFTGKTAGRFTRHQYDLLALLRKVYLVRTVVLQVFNPETGRPERAVEISGRIENLKMADYAYDYLNRVIEEEWQVFNREKTFSHHARTDFAQGLLRGICERLTASAEKAMSASSQTRALVTRLNAELDTYVAHRFPRLRWTSCRGRLVDDHVRRAGEAVGHKTVIFKAVENKPGTRGFLLPPHG